MSLHPLLIRRLILALAVIALLPRPADAQTAKPHLIAILHPESASSENVVEDDKAFRRGMRELGYRDTDFTIVERFADMRVDEILDPGRLPALPAELVQLHPEVIVTNSAAIQAVMRATKTMPIVDAVMVFQPGLCMKVGGCSARY